MIRTTLLALGLGAFALPALAEPFTLFPPETSGIAVPFAFTEADGAALSRYLILLTGSLPVAETLALVHVPAPAMGR
ncbi:hypothetical protein [Roseicyclus sp.]|uniref:hypothetical protein n=1 Tax=Roseicyclus sp. TaxID=1914329 RepID=UPI003FA0731D